MNDISARYGKNVLVVETSIALCVLRIPWDVKESSIPRRKKRLPDIPTQEGQEQFLAESDGYSQEGFKENRGIGVFYWKPAYSRFRIVPKGAMSGKSVYAGKMAAGNAMANMVLFDAAGNANSAPSCISENNVGEE